MIGGARILVTSCRGGSQDSIYIDSQECLKLPQGLQQIGLDREKDLVMRTDSFYAGGGHEPIELVINFVMSVSTREPWSYSSRWATRI